MSYLLQDQQARRNLDGFRNFLILLVAVIAAFTVLFHVLMLYEGRDHSWLTGLYWTLTVMSTLGFGDITFQTDLGRVFCIVVLLTGIVLLLIVLPFAFIRHFYSPWLEAQLRSRAPREVPPDTRQHVLLCQWDAATQGLADRLRYLEIPFYVVEPDHARASSLFTDGIPVITGELDAAGTYAAARAAQARCVFVRLDDATNTNVTLTVRETAPDVPVIAVAEHVESVDVLALAGATQALPLKHKLGEQLASRVNTHHCEAHVVGSFKDLQIAEFPVHNTPLFGQTLRESALRQKTGVNVVGVWERGRLLPARPETRLSDTSVAVIVASKAQIAELNRQVERFDTNEHPVIVVGGGKVGRAAANVLKARGVPVHVVERSPAGAARCESIAERVFVGEASDRETMMQAGIDRAPSVVLSTNDDAMNIYLCIFFRRLNPHLRIVSRITHERNVEAIHRAGADFVLSYATLNQEAVLAFLLGRDLIFVGEGVRFFSLKLPPALAGKTLGESDIGARTGLNVVAILQDGETTTNPQPDMVLSGSCELYALGNPEQRRQYAQLFK